MIVRFLSVLCLGVLVASAHNAEGNNDNEGVPYLELAEPDEGYHGLIRENETLVEVTPAIRARGPLCSFLILNNKHHGEAPFEIMVIDENEARLRVRFPLNCEKRRNYKFDIAAVGCDGSYSNTVPVHITVTDVNEFAPVFPQSAYVKSVDEGRIYDEIVRVEATDRDCTPRYGDVCKYEILTDRSQPFAIDTYGVIRNTEPLDYEKSHNHILSVVAYDCGMMQSAPVMVTIKVNKPCRAGWKGVAERVDYAPGTGPLALFPAARLEACSSDERCPGVTRIQAAVTLQASRAGTGCDRDTYAIHSQRTICGLDPKTVDLLPSPGAGNEWAKALKPDSGRDGEQMFEFDGSTTASAVPSSVLPSSLAGSFSISTWMRHAPPPDHDKHRKEHVLCLADDHKMNRHHYALFVRNCRLILLLRRDFGNGDLNIFRPAEWRWKIPEVCDNEWHHYAVNVRFPNVELFVDGEPYRPVDGKGPEVIDDWPLHPAQGVNTTLVVGACWQGTESDMKHHLHGWLAGLGVLVHAVQPPAALKCVAHCREGLSLAPDLYLKSVSVEGDGVADVETLLRRVAYGDARAFPTPGRRNVHVATTITCDNGRIIKAKPAESYIIVLQPQTPSILINGTDDAARDYAHFRQGLRVFPELSVRVLAAQHGAVRDAETQKLDSCVVSVYPALNPDHEALSLRSASELPLRYDIRAAVTRDGVILTGSDSVHNYQQVNTTQQLDSCVVSVYPALNPDHEALSLRSASELPLRYDIRAAVTRDGVILTGSDSVHNYQQVNTTQQLDSCVVSVYPALNPDHEALSLRSASELPLRYDIRAAVTRDGVILTGSDSVHNYQQVNTTQQLDSCVVSVYPALNPDHEALSLRSASELPLRYDIRAAVTRDGVILTGSDSVHNYQQVNTTQQLDSCVVSVYPALNPDHEALSLRSASELPLRYDIRAAVTRDGVILTGSDSVHNYQQVNTTQQLDSCVVSVYPALNPDHEALSLRSASELPLRYDIRAAVTRDGVILTGSDSVHNYQQVLREIEYSNKKPAYYLNRVFKLTCSELDGRFTSNEYVQTLTVVHPHMSGDGLARELHPSGVADKMDAVARDKQPSHLHGHALQPRVFAAHAQRDAHSAEIPAARLLDAPTSATNHVALLIGVIACGVLVLAGGVGLARARAPRAPRARAPRDEMAWDDSALTITLNPMDEQGAAEMGTAGAAELSSDGESCDDSDSDRHDSSDEDEEVMSGKQHKYRNISQLEWDNSTM
ncbi:calsyntenin-1 [Cydia strobilella]|uniref:calsyntenin-1 n=1 Tax=Cydia strobilella TaxID=1100964 RepID=UPI0030049ABF